MAALGISLEIGRRIDPRINTFCMSLFGRTAHPHEAHRVNSATWYAVAVLLMAICQSAVPAAIALVVVLGVGDPIAAIVGVAGARVRRERPLASRAWRSSPPAGTRGRGLSGSLPSRDRPRRHASRPPSWAPDRGALAELFSRRIDDNFSIPLAAFGAAFLTLAAL